MLNSIRKRSYLGLLLVMSMMLYGFLPNEQDPPQGNDLNMHITQIDTSQFPKVSVYVSVTNAAGEPVPVNPADIQLEENDQLISADQIIGIGEAGSLTTMLVMDNSGSMNSGDKLASAKAAAQAYVQQMRPGDQAGLLTFNTNIKLVHDLTNDRQALIASIQSITAKNDTTMYDALIKAVELLEP
ncbi:MAG: VWA domain-containing protein, partial [Chloroflexi bacterium]|nr:VWA domain-containing protein [Chloroflexota bacterium]